MAPDAAFFQTLFQQFPQPVLWIDRACTVRFRSCAAAALFPGLAEGDPCPPALQPFLLPLEADAASVCTLDGRDFSISIRVLDEGWFLILHPAAGRSEPVSLQFILRLRQHTAALSMAAQRLEQTDRAADPQAARHWQGTIQQGLHRLLRDIDLAELDRALEEDDPAVFRPAPLDLAELCRELEREAGALIRNTGRQFRAEINPDHLPVDGDAMLLRRMLLELISNAAKAAGTEGRIEFSLAHGKNRAFITLRDNGPGLSQSSLAALFCQAPAQSVPAPTDGVGLGLSLVRQIAALHGGVVLAESREGEGTVFRISLPTLADGRLPFASPRPFADRYGGFSQVLVELADILPWQAFLSEESDL